ncbi:MAG: hypothetical protein OEP45_12310 [Acidobacteriota bacterium]|nr:hypothetical protein [Acidobacteriota bacterium]
MHHSNIRRERRRRDAPTGPGRGSSGRSRHELGSDRLGTYTIGWWLLDYEVDGRRIAAFYAGSNGGNYVIGVPELDLAIAFQASNYNQSVQHRTKLEDVPAFILRSALEGAP